MAEAEEVKTETVTVTLTEDTLAGLRLIAEHKGITVEEVIGRLAVRRRENRAHGEEREREAQGDRAADF